MALPKGDSLEQRSVEFGSDDGGLRVWYLENKWYFESKVVEEKAFSAVCEMVLEEGPSAIGAAGKKAQETGGERPKKSSVMSTTNSA